MMQLRTIEMFKTEVEVYRVGWMVSRPVYTGSDQRELPPPDDDIAFFPEREDALAFCQELGFRWDERMYCWRGIGDYNRLNVGQKKIRV